MSTFTVYSVILFAVSARVGGKIVLLLCLRPGGIKRWWCLTSVRRLSPKSGRRADCAAGRLHGAYWLIGPGSAGLAQGCRSALPFAGLGGGISWRPPAYRLFWEWSLFVHLI